MKDKIPEKHAAPVRSLEKKRTELFPVQFVLDNILDIVIVADAEGFVLTLNKRAEQLLGTQSAEKKIPVDSILSVSGQESCTAWFSSAGIPVNGTLAGAGGEKIPVELHAHEFVTGGGTRYLILGADVRLQYQLIQEVAERENVVRHLALSENKFSAMFLNNSAGIVILDAETELVTDVNPAAERIFRSKSENIVGKSLQELGFQCSGQEWLEFLENVMEKRQTQELKRAFLVNGDRIVCMCSAVFLEINQRSCIMIDIADVTQQEKLRKSVETKQKLETVGFLAGGIAHDFNNILAVILGYIGIAKLKNTDSQMVYSLEEAERACLRAREMTQNLLTFSRGGEPVLSACDPCLIVSDAARFVFKDSSVDVRFSFAPDTWYIMADQIQFSQVICNLMMNSLQSMDRDGILYVGIKNADFSDTPPQECPLSADGHRIVPGPYVCITIRDTGPGIPPEIIDKIYEPFFTSGKKGMGMGLAIVLSVMQRHHGGVSVSSGYNEGAEFVLHVPAVQDPVVCDSQAPQHHEGYGKNILVMDDDKLVRNAVTDILDTLGYRVTTASCSSETIEAYCSCAPENRYDAVILDLVVPYGKNGVETAEILRAIDKDVVLLVSSGYSDDPVLAQYSKYGFNGIIPKPYTLDEVDRVLKSVLP